jgi:hypothetical protein
MVHSSFSVLLPNRMTRERSVCERHYFSERILAAIKKQSSGGNDVASASGATASGERRASGEFSFNNFLLNVLLPLLNELSRPIRKVCPRRPSRGEVVPHLYRLSL